MKFRIEDETIVSTGFLKIKSANVVYDKFDGSTQIQVKREMMDRSDSVAILIRETDTDTILFTKQFRYPIAAKDAAENIADAGWLLELPAGKIDEIETPLEAAIRETSEEIGYDISSSTHTKPIQIASFYASPGGTSEKITIFYCEVESKNKTTTGGGLATEHEDIQLVKIPVSEIKRMLENGDVRDGKTLVGLGWLVMN